MRNESEGRDTGLREETGKGNILFVPKLLGPETLISETKIRSEEIGNRNQWWVHQAHGLAHWFRSHPTPSQPSVLPSPSAFPSWGIYITGSSLIGVASKTPRITSKNLISEQKVSANKLKQQAVKASYEHERQKYAETSQSIPSYSCPNGGIISSHYFPC